MAEASFFPIVSNKDASTPGSTDTSQLFLYYVFTSDEKKDPKFEATQTAPGKATATKLKGGKLLPKHDDGKSISRVFQQPVTPGSPVTVTVVRAGGAVIRQDTFQLSPALSLGSAQDFVPTIDNPARLALALNTTFVPERKPGGDPDASAGAVQEILEYVHERLMQSMLAAFIGPDGGALAMETDPKKLPVEESWARLASEIIQFMPYALPSTLYSQPGGVEFADEHLYLKMQDLTDPGYPIVGECQHLCTYGAILRGFQMPTCKKDSTGKKLQEVKKSGQLFVLNQHPPYTAGDSTGSVVNPVINGQWVGAGLSAPVAVSEAFKLGVAPGSAFAFSKKANSGGAHIGFVLRVDTPNKRIQFLDTGGLQLRRPEVVTAMGNAGSTGVSAGTFDDPWTSESIHGSGDPPNGFSILPAAPNLAAAVKRFAAARPIGLVRLVLESRSGGILYASPLLRMHFDGGSSPQNLSYARLMWALRGHPRHETITAHWLVDVPRGRLTDAMLGTDAMVEAHPGGAAKHAPSPRTLALPALLTQTLKPGATLPDPKKPFPVALTFVAADFLSKADGAVSVARRFSQKAGKHVPDDRPKAFLTLPWGERSGSVTLADSAFDRCPYFRGDPIP